MKSHRVGIMADSHGRPEKIAGAIAFFKRMECRRIYHLGDICDSANPQTAEACVHLLRENGVLGIKGNNDHGIVVNQQGRKETAIPSSTYQYLKDLPLILSYRGACFTHSIPFVKKLGLSSMIGNMGKAEAVRFFENSPKGILFRGHGHSPEIMWQEDHRIRSQALSRGECVDLSNRRPCVVTCGALTDGLCMVWDPDRRDLHALTF